MEGTARLTAESARTIDNIAAILKAYPSVKVQLQGHTDNTGDAAENQRLSQARADEVKNRLVASGVAAERLEAVGYGSGRPIVPNGTPEGRARNRRTELVVTQR